MNETSIKRLSKNFFVQLNIMTKKEKKNAGCYILVLMDSVFFLCVAKI